MAYPVYEDNGGIFAEGDQSVTVDYPATVNNNDIAIAQLGDADNDTFTVPGDWELIWDVGTSANWSICYMWRRCDGTEGGTTQRFDSQLTAGSGVYGLISTYSGCATTDPPFYDGSPSTGGWSGSGVTQSTTYLRHYINPPDGEDSLVLTITSVEDNVSISTTPGFTWGYTEESTFGGDAAFEMNYAQVGSGYVSATDGSLGGSEYQGSLTIALKPVAVKRRRPVFTT